MAISFSVNGASSSPTLLGAYVAACQSSFGSSVGAVQYYIGNGLDKVNCSNGAWGVVGTIDHPVLIVSGVDSAASSSSYVSPDDEQVNAINALFPVVLTALALVWGGKRVFELLWSGVLNMRSPGGKDE